MKIRKIKMKLFVKSVNKKEEETGMGLRQVLVSSSLIHKLPARPPPLAVGITRREGGGLKISLRNNPIPRTHTRAWAEKRRVGRVWEW